MTTFAMGGMQVWMPTFLVAFCAELRSITPTWSLAESRRSTLSRQLSWAVGWAIVLLKRTASAYYLVSAATLALSVPAMLLAIYKTGPMMFPAIFLAEFLLFLEYRSTECGGGELRGRGDPRDGNCAEPIRHPSAWRRVLANADRAHLRCKQSANWFSRCDCCDRAGLTRPVLRHAICA